MLKPLRLHLRCLLQRTTHLSKRSPAVVQVLVAHGGVPGSAVPIDAGAPRAGVIGAPGAIRLSNEAASLGGLVFVPLGRMIDRLDASLQKLERHLAVLLWPHIARFRKAKPARRG